MSAHGFVSGIPLVLGGNVFGFTSKGDEAFAVLDAFYEAGGRMIDTADVYSAWVPGHKGGESETVLGEWLESRGVRDDMRLHTKTGMLGGSELYEPARVIQSLDASLERLRTDRVDLYYAHKDYPELPIEQIVEAFDGAVRSGKALSVGASNFDEHRLLAALDHAPLEAIRGGDPAHNARALAALLDGEHNAYRETVKFNAAAALIVAGRTEDWAEGAAMAAEALDSGATKALLERWIAMAK